MSLRPELPQLQIAIVCPVDDTALNFRMAKIIIGEQHRYHHHDFGSPILDHNINLVIIVCGRKYHSCDVSQRKAWVEQAFRGRRGLLLTQIAVGRDMALWLQTQPHIWQRGLWPCRNDITVDIAKLLGLPPTQSPDSISTPH